MENQTRPAEPFIFGTHPCASVGIVTQISTVLQSSATFECGVESTEIVDVSMTSTTDSPEDHCQEFVSFSSTHHSAQEIDPKANNDGSLEHISQNQDSDINGLVGEAVGDAVETEQVDSNGGKMSSKKGSEQMRYESNEKESNRAMNGNGTSSVKERGEPVSSPVSSTTLPLLSRLDRLDIVIAYLEDKSLSCGNSIPAPNQDGESAKPTFENSSSTKSLENRCKSINSVLVETEAKGNIVQRVVSLENKVSKLSEDIERMITSVRSGEATTVDMKGEATTVNMKGSDTATGFDIFEEDKHQLLPDEESVQKGVHDHIPMPGPQLQLDTAKTKISSPVVKNDENLLADRKTHSETVLKGAMDGDSETKAIKKIASKDTTRATRVNKKGFSKDENKSPTSGKGRLRHLLPECIFPHSLKA